MASPSLFLELLSHLIKILMDIVGKQLSIPLRLSDVGMAHHLADVFNGHALP